jgi:hypothetical protein
MLVEVSEKVDTNKAGPGAYQYVDINKLQIAYPNNYSLCFKIYDVLAL